MVKSNTIRKNFSISRKFQEVDEILASLPDSDQSRFICEAILHYNEYKNNPNWLLQQVAPIVQMQQQLSALYPNQGIGYAAQQPVSPVPSNQNEYTPELKETKSRTESTNSANQSKLRDQSTTKEIIDTNTEYVEEVSVKKEPEDTPIKEEVEMEDKSTQKPPRKRSTLASTFDT